MLNAEVRSMVEGKGFETAMCNAADDPDTKAFLMIKALDEIALDPTVGNTMDAFIFIYGQGGGNVCFNIRFDRFVNFIGLIELPENSGRAKQLMEAIKKNLNGKMFKAAKMHRRLDARSVRLFQQARDRASEAYSAVIQAGYAGGKRIPGVNMEELKVRAAAAYNKVFNPRKLQLQNRCRNVGRAACPGFQGGYTEAVASFLYRHLPFTGITH